MFLLVTVVTRDAARLGEIVAVGTGDGHVSWYVRRTGTARCYIAKFSGLHTCGVENTRVCQCD